MKQDEIKPNFSEMIKNNPENLNIFWNERRLIILALLKTNFDLQKACELNFTNMELDVYRKLIHRKYNIKLKELKKYFKHEK